MDKSVTERLWSDFESYLITIPLNIHFQLGLQRGINRAVMPTSRYYESLGVLGVSRCLLFRLRVRKGEFDWKLHRDIVSDFVNVKLIHPDDAQRYWFLVYITKDTPEEMAFLNKQEFKVSAS